MDYLENAAVHKHTEAIAITWSSLAIVRLGCTLHKGIVTWREASGCSPWWRGDASISWTPLAPRWLCILALFWKRYSHDLVCQEFDLWTWLHLVCRSEHHYHLQQLCCTSNWTCVHGVSHQGSRTWLILRPIQHRRAYVASFPSLTFLINLEIRSYVHV